MNTVISFGATASGHTLISIVLLQLVLIIVAARLFGWLARKLSQPVVVGEIIGGLLMGPTFFRPLFPEVFEFIFDPAVKPVFTSMKELGLMMLLFIVGMEFEFSHLRHLGKAAVMISLIGIVLPFSFGVSLAPWLHAELEMTTELWGLILFLGCALSITALPILGRIMIEMGITKTRLATVTISAAAVDDAIAWILLATIVAAVEAKFNLMNMVIMIASTILFLTCMIAMVRPWLRRWLDFHLKDKAQLDAVGFTVILTLLFICGWITLKIGIFASFGAFVLGTTLAGHQKFHDALGDSFRSFVSSFFMPIFFTYTGLQTDVGQLNSWQQVMFLLLIVTAAIVGKLVGCGLAARWSGFSWREAGIVGTMMNTRALMALIVINVGMDHGILNPAIFTMLVLMAIITTIMTTPLLGLLYPGTELEQPIQQSGFFQRAI